MNFEDAARAQHLRSSFYTVWLVAPDGTRQQIGATARKSMDGLLKLLARDSVQAIVKQWPNVETMRVRKSKGVLIFDNGYRMEFGGTIRQEAN